jgi:hypothetical protein
MPGPSAAQDRPSTEPNATVQPLQVVRTLQLGQQARLPASSIRAGEAVHQYIALRLPIAERQAALMLQHPRSCPPHTRHQYTSERLCKKRGTRNQIRPLSAPKPATRVRPGQHLFRRCWPERTKNRNGRRRTEATVSITILSLWACSKTPPAGFGLGRA